MEEEKKWCVYCHTNKINGKKYIGITKNKPEYRWGKNGNSYIRRNQYFGNAIKKYGWNKFEHKIIKENISEKQAKQMEIELISKYNTKDKQFGYNLTIGGEGTIGYKWSKEQRNKQKDIQLKCHKSGGEHPQAKKILFNGRIYNHISDQDLINEINKYYKVKISTVRSYLNKKHLPIELYSLGLKYKNDSINNYTYFSKESLSEKRKQKRNCTPWNKGTNIKTCNNDKRVCYNNRIYNSLSDFAKEENICLSTASNIINGKTIVTKKYLIGELRFEDISFEEQLKIFKYNKNRRENEKYILFNEIRYDNVVCVSQELKEERRKVQSWLSNRESMPKKYVELGLRYEDKDYDQFIINKNKKAKKDNKKFVKVFCDDKVFKNMSDFCRYEKVSNSMICQYLSNKKPMPQKWKDRGLRYYNTETDKDLPIYENKEQ